MRRPYYPWSLRSLLEGRPSVGSLLDLCEENYGLLRRLAPQLPEMQNRHLSQAGDGVGLHLEIRSQTPYTSLIQLTYRFSEKDCVSDDPAALLRAYHDARQLEVLELRQHILSLDPRPDMASMERKWRLNLFLSKWLGYCCRRGHRFSTASEISDSCPEALLCP